ncbi:MAG: chemotaxis protein CheD [Defluviitaleaceae bacterium]|nr:chemotaxis protein CheD [Defluviitaleaceae bacterium]
MSNSPAKTIIVGMADLSVSKSPDVLTTLGLGSCVGIVLHDAVNKIGGLAHVMLPDSKTITNNSNIAKFVDTAVVDMLEKMKRLGANKIHIKAKLIGGAQMFSVVANNEKMKIGERNVEASVLILKNLNIPILAQEVGKNYGRTVEFNIATGAVLVKTISQGNKLI